MASHQQIQAAKWRDGGYIAQSAKKGKHPKLTMREALKKLIEFADWLEAYQADITPPATVHQAAGAAAVVPAVSPAVPVIPVVPVVAASVSQVHFGSIDYKIMIKPGQTVDVEHLKLLSGLLVKEQIVGEQLLSILIDLSEKTLGPENSVPWLPSLFRAGLRASFRE
jgi:hypothetical protein